MAELPSAGQRSDGKQLDNEEGNPIPTNNFTIRNLENGAIPSFKTRGLKFAHLNIHSLVSKMDELRHILKNSPFDVIGLNEIMCDSIPASELYINNYVLLRRDRNRHGGGVAVYVSNKFDYKRRDDLNNSNLECLWFELHYPNKSPVLVGEFYRPPNSKADFFEEFDTTLDCAMSQNLSCIILGDFNCNFMPDQHDCNAQKYHSMQVCMDLTNWSMRPQELQTRRVQQLI